MLGAFGSVVMFLITATTKSFSVYHLELDNYYIVACLRLDFKGDVSGV